MRQVDLAHLTGPAPERLVHAGGVVRYAACRLTGETLELPDSLLKEAGLEPGAMIHAYAPDDRHVHLGPYVGVLLGADGVAKLHGDGAERYRQIARIGREAGVVPLYFQWTDVDAAAGTVGAWTDRGGHWERHYFPIPDVIYNRATHSDPAERTLVKMLLRRLQALYGVVFINRTNAFSKMAVHEALRFFEPYAPLTPETELFAGPETLDRMLKRHPRVFLKANHGTHGTDVLRVRADDDAWQMTGQCGGKAVDERFEALTQLEDFLRLLRGETEWVVQQGITLPEVEGRVYDLRVLLQKDGAGEWAVPLVLIRWAQPGKVTANMSQGADPFLAPAFRERVGEAVPAHLEETAIGASLRVATALEAKFGLLGEIGIDLGLDSEERPWIFEANAKPLHPQVPGANDPYYFHPFCYARYLAGQAWAGRHSGISTAVSLA
jgi:hypothetical protein